MSYTLEEHNKKAIENKEMIELILDELNRLEHKRREIIDTISDLQQEYFSVFISERDKLTFKKLDFIRKINIINQTLDKINEEIEIKTIEHDKTPGSDSCHNFLKVYSPTEEKDEDEMIEIIKDKINSNCIRNLPFNFTP